MKTIDKSTKVLKVPNIVYFGITDMVIIIRNDEVSIKAKPKI